VIVGRRRRAAATPSTTRRTSEPTVRSSVLPTWAAGVLGGRLRHRAGLAEAIKAFHEGWLLIAASWETGFGFRHVTGKVYGSKDSPTALRDANEVLQALRLFGYPEHEARAVLEATRPLLDRSELTFEDLEDTALRMGGPVTIMRFGLDPAAAHVGNTPTIEELTALVQRVSETSS
jgi:hypothetical protein